MANENTPVVEVEETEEQAIASAGGDLKVALHQEREKRKAETKRAKELEDKVKQIEPYADEYKVLLPYLPALLKKAGGTKPTAEGVEQPDDPELVEMARDLGLETEDGKPDAKRAQKVLGYIDRRTGTKVQAGVQPIADESAKVQVQQLKERAYAAKDEEGRPFAKREAIDKIFSQIDPRQLLNPDGAVAAMLMARGLSGAGDLEDAEPVFTERPGGRPRRPSKAPLSDMGKSIAKIRGKKEDDWEKMHDEPSETGWDLE